MSADSDNHPPKPRKPRRSDLTKPNKNEGKPAMNVTNSDGPFEVIVNSSEGAPNADCTSFLYSSFDRAVDAFRCKSAETSGTKAVALVFDHPELNGRSIAQFTHLESGTAH